MSERFSARVLVLKNVGGFDPMQDHVHRANDVGKTLFSFAVMCAFAACQHRRREVFGGLQVQICFNKKPA